MEEQTEEIEINFRLDEHGRTALSAAQEDDDSRSICAYATKTLTTQFDVAPDTELYDELLFDCEIADSGLMPRTFWVPADHTSFQPRCTLEQMTRDIFLKHTSDFQGQFDPATSGAEWWVQLRPPPPAGRYSMHTSDDDNGVSFHWDKDEDLRLLCGGTTYVHPHLSTVTYLTNLGAPTLIAEGFRVHNLTGDWIKPEHSSAFISWPATGKHLCFDGRYLHAAPTDLMAPGAFVKQCQIPETSDEKLKKVFQRRYRRCTFLVNIWLNHHPFNVHPFPETMIDKLSGYKQQKEEEAARTRSRRIRLSFDPNGNESTCVEIVKMDETALKESEHQFVWPMGDCNSGETIRAAMPLELVRSKAGIGGNVCVQWKNREHMVLQKKSVQSNSSKRPRVDHEKSESRCCGDSSA